MRIVPYSVPEGRAGSDDGPSRPSPLKSSATDPSLESLAVLPRLQSDSSPEISAESQQSNTGSPSNLASSSASDMPLLLTYGEAQPPRFRYRWNQQWDEPRGFVPLTRTFLPSGVGAGLINLGLTCFINSILQCLTHTVPLARSLLCSDHSIANPCNRARDDFCLQCALCDHIELSLKSSGRVIVPEKIVNNLNKISPYFQSDQQEDAHEFQQAMLDKLERCCLDQKKDRDSPAPKNIVNEVFGGRLLSKLQCCNCGHSSSTYEPLIDLSLEIEHAETLTAALESFTNVEKMEDPDSKFRCQNCNEYVSIEKQLLVEKEPAIAALHLKRFKSAGFTVEKIDKHVTFPLELDLRPFTSGRESDVELKYQLYAVVVHNGMSPTWGHYFSFVQSSPGIWHKFDDAQVVRVREKTVLSQDAYILFYAKHGTPWFSSLMEEWKADNSNLIWGTSPTSVLDKVDSPRSLRRAFPSMENFTCQEAADNSMGVSASTSNPRKVHSPYRHPTFHNIGSSTSHEAASAAFAIDVLLPSEKFGDMAMNETGVNEGGSQGSRDGGRLVERLFDKEGECSAGPSNEDVGQNHGPDDVESDGNSHPLTPSESSSPESNSIHGKRPSEASNNAITTSQHHRKIRRRSCRKQLIKSLGDSKKKEKEALRFMRGMPMRRACLFYNAARGPLRSPASKKKATVRQRTGEYLFEKPRCDQPILPPAVL